MVGHPVDKHVVELQSDALGILIIVGYISAGFLFILAIAAHAFAALLPLGLVLVTLLVSDQLKRRNRLRIASWLLILSLIAAPVIDLGVRGNSVSIYFLLLLPVVATSLLIDGRATLTVSLLVIVLMFALTLPSEGTTGTVSLVFIPALVCLLIGGISYLNEYNILQMVYWALDIQQKDTQRAEMLYKQGQDLKQALLEIQHAHAKLELLNTELEEARRKTELASKAKSTFLSNMSHELRTPLNVIIGYTSSMLNMPLMYENVPLPPVYRADINLIKENGQYLVGLINDILDLSKIEVGKLELHREPVNLPEILQGVISTSAALVKDKPLEIRPDFPDDLPQVWADPMRVRQILLNLMSNAIKFTQKGSVTLQARHVGDKVQISVVDTGIGIPEKSLVHIFDRFEQAEQDTDKHYGGTGLGLDISKQLSLMHGSNLTAQSVVGEGSTFTFFLPLLTPEQGGEQASGLGTVRSSVAMLQPVEGSASQTRTILLVEDEVSTRDLMRRALQAAGHAVVDTADGAKVQDMAAALLPDLIILDIQLPNVDGWKILENLKKNMETARIPVAVCTGFQDEVKAASMGASVFILKPFTPDQLMERLQATLMLKV